MWVRKISISLLILGILGCVSYEQYARGDARDVMIVFDGTLREARFLRDILQDTFYTPHAEPLFNIYPLQVEQFQSYRGYKNVVLLATYGARSFELFQEAFGEKGSGMYKGKNIFADGDFVIGILASDEYNLLDFLNIHKEEIKNLLLERVNELYSVKTYFAGHNKKMKKEFGGKYGFTFDFPNGWAYAIEDTNFVCIAKHYPDRFMSVYFESFERPLEKEDLIALRNSLGKRYFEGDRVEKDYTRASRIPFKGVLATRIYGVWQNDSLIRGGPFEMIAFNMNGRFYLIDMGVFAPEKLRKLEYLMRMELVARTFEIVSP